LSNRTSFEQKWLTCWGGGGGVCFDPVGTMGCKYPEKKQKKKREGGVIKKVGINRSHPMGGKDQQKKT